MDLQKFGIKLFVTTNGSFDSKDFIPVFHNWIQDKVVPNHMLIDVADYSHIPDGPGVMLIAHEGHFSLDQENYKAGMMYMRRSKWGGDFKERFINVFSTAILAVNRLRNNKMIKEVDFIHNSFRFIPNDRRVADNTYENQNLYKDEVKKALAEIYPTCKVTYAHVSKENERLAFTVNFRQDINIFEQH